jgi:hypothetical protein
MGDKLVANQFQILGGDMEELRKLWKQLERVYPIFRAAEGLAYIGLIIVLMVSITHIWPGTDLAYGAFIVGIILSAVIAMATVYPHFDPEFDLKEFLRDLDRFDSWFWSKGVWCMGMLLGVIIAANVLLSVVY